MQFDRQYMKARTRLSWRAPFIVNSIISVIKPTTIVDFGCATGDLVKSFLDFGCDAYGVDLHVKEEDLLFDPRRFFRCDLREPIYCFPEHFRTASCLVLCIEVLGLLKLADINEAVYNLAWRGETCITALGEGEKEEEVRKHMLAYGMTERFDLRNRIREQLEPLKGRKAVKAFYNGVRVWRDE